MLGKNYTLYLSSPLANLMEVRERAEEKRETTTSNKTLSSWTNHPICLQIAKEKILVLRKCM